MDLSAQSLHRQLDVIADEGWDGPVAAQLLGELRTHVVRPVVRASRLRGPAADQAEATAWAAAWEAIRRPSARSAENPGGMVWSAVRRSVVTEVQLGNRGGTPVGDIRELDLISVPGAGRPVWGDQSDVSRSFLGTACLRHVIDLLVTVGWDHHIIEDVIALLADVGKALGWRTVARRLGVPAWQVRRVSLLVVPGPGPTLLELVSTHGAAAVTHPAALWAARSTVVHWQSGPQQSLEQLGRALGHASTERVRSHPQGGVDQCGLTDLAGRESADQMGVLR